jgi:hypothetical protein
MTTNPPALLGGAIIIGLFLLLVLGIVVVLALLGARERTRRNGLIELARAQVSVAGGAQEPPEWCMHANQELLDSAELWVTMAHWYRESTGVDLDPRPPMPADEALQVDDGRGGPKMGTPGAHGAV